MTRDWKEIKHYEEIKFELWEGIAKITINRPHRRNAFTPQTTWEMSDAMYIARERADVRVVVLTGADSPRLDGQSEEDWPKRAGRSEADTQHSQACHRHGQRLCCRRRTRLARSVRPHHRQQQREVRTDRPQSGQFRCRIRQFLPGTHRWTEESP